MRARPEAETESGRPRSAQNRVSNAKQVCQVPCDCTTSYIAYNSVARHGTLEPYLIPISVHCSSLYILQRGTVLQTMRRNATRPTEVQRLQAAKSDVEKALQFKEVRTELGRHGRECGEL